MRPLRIVASEPLKKKILEVTAEGVAYTESAAFGMGPKRSIPFFQIDAVLRNVLEPIISLQVGVEVIKIRYKKGDETHRAAIEQIVAGARRSVVRAPAPPPVPPS
jgi:hypothetical protein